MEIQICTAMSALEAWDCVYYNLHIIIIDEMTEIITIIAQKGEQTLCDNNRVIITSHFLKIFTQTLFISLQDAQEGQLTGSEGSVFHHFGDHGEGDDVAGDADVAQRLEAVGGHQVAANGGRHGPEGEEWWVWFRGVWLADAVHPISQLDFLKWGIQFSLNKWPQPAGSTMI